MVNDMTIIGGILTFFILFGAYIPYMNAEYGTNYAEEDIDGLTSTVGDSTLSSVSAWSVLVSIAGIFTWHTGIGVLANLFFWIIKILLILIISRNIWIGGGG